MKTLKKVYYHQLEKVKETLKVEQLYCIPVFQESLSEKEIENLKMDNFLSVWRRNFDWYFSENNWNIQTEKLENIYFSKEKLDHEKFEYLDFIDELEIYMFTPKNA